jgi:hypothetical protein
MIEVDILSTIYPTLNYPLKHIATIIVPCVPRVGEFFRINDYEAEIFNVEWTIVYGKVKVTIHVDGASCGYDLSKSEVEIGTC